MARKVLMFAGALALGSALGYAAVQAIRDVKQEKPTLHRVGSPLADLIPPGQKEITVQKDQSPPGIVQPPAGMGQLEWMTSVSNAVFVIRVSGLSPRLTPQRDWITTTVAAEIESIIKISAAADVRIGSAISFEQDGGDLAINGTSVHARLHWTDPFNTGKRYLIFAGRSGDTWQVSSAVAYEIDSDDRLAPLGRGDAPVTQGARSERAVQLSTALARIRSVIKAKS